ncbi:hypothetical protein AX769_11290 [Frondihabitans sp. PAMC 28766]|nr:hypothetical protein AX769_11290 [Frondihabitans sp. PAMC 28766]
MREREEHAAEMVAMLSRSGMGMAEYWSGDAADEWADRIRDDLRAYSQLNEVAESTCSAVLVYVDTLQGIKRRVASARSRLVEAQDATAKLTRQQDEPSPQLQPQLDAAADDASAAQRALACLADERRDADHVLCSRLRSASDAVRRSAPVSAFNGSALKSLAPEALLKQFSRLNEAQLEAVLNEHPDLVTRLEGAQPAAVASWWESLSPTKQEDLIEAAPALIGNIDGVAFAARDQANRLSLASELVRTKADLTAAEEHNEHVAPTYRWDTDVLREQVRALQAVGRAARPGPDNQNRFVVTLDLTGRPKAAVAVGNPDTASQVTVTVPGMGTTVGGSMESWTTAAANLQRSQKKANLLFNGGRESGLAAVAWIGYDAPNMPPSAQVLGNQKAREGGMRLSRFLDGVSAARGWKDGENLSVVAHSYGTTTAASALESTRVESFTMLASAGLEATSVKDLKVDSANVWATQAWGDQVANVGRGQPTWGHVPFFRLPSMHKIDPETLASAQTPLALKKPRSQGRPSFGPTATQRRLRSMQH